LLHPEWERSNEIRLTKTQITPFISSFRQNEQPPSLCYSFDFVPLDHPKPGLGGARGVQGRITRMICKLHDSDKPFLKSW